MPFYPLISKPKQKHSFSLADSPLFLAF